MSSPLRFGWILSLAAGLLIGGVGAVFFRESLPGAEGSDKERADKLEVELQRANRRVAALESIDGLARKRSGPAAGDTATEAARRRSGPTLADEARSLAADIRAGRPINPEDIFRASKPLIRDLAPLFNRMRLKEQQAMMDSLSGELARKYGLAPEKQEVLKKWFAQRAEVEAKRWSDLLAADGTRLDDVVRASRDVRPDEGIEAVMSGLLPADKFAAFKAERLAERAGRVQREADARVHQLDSVVALDEAQRDRVFAIMARNSREYDPAMVLEGVGGELGAPTVADRNAAVLGVLRSDQRAAYEAEKQRRRDAAAKEMAEIGLALPPTWELFDDHLP